MRPEGRNSATPVPTPSSRVQSIWLISVSHRDYAGLQDHGKGGFLIARDNKRAKVALSSIIIVS
jgi:hypothetical protein